MRNDLQETNTQASTAVRPTVSQTVSQALIGGAALDQPWLNSGLGRSPLQPTSQVQYELALLQAAVRESHCAVRARWLKEQTNTSVR